MRSVYDRACGYAYKCCPPLYKDLVHEAWLRHFRKEGSDLFERDIYIVLRWVRNVWFSEIRDRKYMKNGEYFTRQFFDVTEMPIASRQSLPDQQLISKDFFEDLFDRVDNYASGHSRNCTVSVDPKYLRQFVEMTNNGYTMTEIAKAMNMSQQRIYYYKLKIQRIINEMTEYTNNPFAGSKVKIKKKITRKTFEAHPEKYGEFVYDADRDCDSNEYYTIVCNGSDYILIREHGKD